MVSEILEKKIEVF